jgi:hypothetical protein
MTQGEILDELKKLTTAERLAVMEAALRLIREDLRETERLLPFIERKQQLTTAAEALLRDYQTGGELTAFTALDSEDFSAEG